MLCKHVFLSFVLNYLIFLLSCPVWHTRVDQYSCLCLFLTIMVISYNRSWSKNGQLQLVLSLFLNFGKIQNLCSYKVVLTKKECKSYELSNEKLELESDRNIWPTILGVKIYMKFVNLAPLRSDTKNYFWRQLPPFFLLLQSQINPLIPTFITSKYL